MSCKVLCNCNEIDNVRTVLHGDAFAQTCLPWKRKNNFHIIICVDVAVSSVKVSSVTMENATLGSFYTHGTPKYFVLLLTMVNIGYSRLLNSIL